MIRKLIQHLNSSGVTIFLTTHYIEEADQLCQRVAMINKGKLVGIDSPQRLKASVEKHQIVEVSFDKAETLENRLKSISGIEEVEQFGDKFRLHVRNTSEIIPILGDFSRDNGLKIISIATLSSTLEDAFVQYTGLSVDVLKTEKEQGKKAENLG
jgi:ABC-2 type transport system ATP-binding protein